MKTKVGGAQGQPHQHCVSKEGTGIFAVQRKAVAGDGFTGEVQEVQEIAGKSLWTLKNKWVHSLSSPLTEKVRHSHFHLDQANSLTEVLLLGIDPENPERRSHFPLSPSPGCTARKLMLSIV